MGAILFSSWAITADTAFRLSRYFETTTGNAPGSNLLIRLLSAEWCGRGRLLWAYFFFRNFFSHKNTRYEIFKAFPSFFAISFPIGRLQFSISEMWRCGIPANRASSRWVIPSLPLAPIRAAPGVKSSSLKHSRHGIDSETSTKPMAFRVSTGSLRFRDIPVSRMSGSTLSCPTSIRA